VWALYPRFVHVEGAGLTDIRSTRRHPDPGTGDGWHATFGDQVIDPVIDYPSGYPIDRDGPELRNKVECRGDRG